MRKWHFSDYETEYGARYWNYLKIGAVAKRRQRKTDNPEWFESSDDEHLVTALLHWTATRTEVQRPKSRHLASLTLLTPHHHPRVDYRTDGSMPCLYVFCVGRHATKVNFMLDRRAEKSFINLWFRLCKLDCYVGIFILFNLLWFFELFRSLD